MVTFDLILDLHVCCPLRLVTVDLRCYCRLLCYVTHLPDYARTVAHTLRLPGSRRFTRVHTHTALRTHGYAPLRTPGLVCWTTYTHTGWFCYTHTLRLLPLPAHAVRRTVPTLDARLLRTRTRIRGWLDCVGWIYGYVTVYVPFAL